MGWQDRIRSAQYDAPSGSTHPFDFEDVSRSQDFKNSAFEYPDGEGTYVQSLGSTGRRYPIQAIFWGDDYDLAATAFEQALAERGAGLLTHPIYGQIDVVPVGSVDRTDRLKSGANQAVVAVTFYETTGVVYPDGVANPADAIVASVAAFNDASAADFADGLNVATVSEGVTFANQFKNFIATVDGALSEVAEQQADVFSQYDAVKASIDTGIDVLVGKPLTLAFQAQRLSQLPAQVAGGAAARLDAYGNLARSLSGAPTASRGLDNLALNAFKGGEVNATAAVAAMALSIVTSEFETQNDALSAADDVLSAFDAVVAWRDANYPALGIIDTGDGYQRLQDAVATAAGFAVDLSFSLKREQRLTLTRSRSIIDLVAELYGSVDDRLDFFINSNSLTGDEILEIPAGRTVVYYV